MPRGLAARGASRDGLRQARGGWLGKWVGSLFPRFFRARKKAPDPIFRPKEFRHGRLAREKPPTPNHPSHPNAATGKGAALLKFRPVVHIPALGSKPNQTIDAGKEP